MSILLNEEGTFDGDVVEVHSPGVAKSSLCDVSGMALLSHILRIPDLDYPSQLCGWGMFDDEVPKPGTFGESRNRNGGDAATG